MNGIVGAMLGLEGCHALEGEADNLDVLFDRGYRMLGMAHFFDNELAGSAHGLAKGGLSETGREVVARAQKLGVLIDLAHASPKTFYDVIAMAEKPVVVSHTGVNGAYESSRNLSDEQLRAIAATGGVVGIGFFSGATGGDDVESIIRAIVHAVTVAGVEHVALGSDFDGAVTTPMDVSGMNLITRGLRDAGFDEAQIRAIMGGNVERALRDALPAE